LLTAYVYYWSEQQKAMLAKCLEALKGGDVLTVWKLDHLGRPLQDLICWMI